MTDKIWLGEQERAYSCGAASLKYALCVLGYSPREAQLRRLAKTTWRGTQTKPLVAAAQKLGVTAKVKHFLEDEWQEARAWLHTELAAGKPVILDVDGFEHYVVAVQMIGERVMIIDPEGGPMDGSAYATIVLCGDKRLHAWWLSGDEHGEPDAFRGISFQAPKDTTAHRLRFTEAVVKRYAQGRQWILDEYLLDTIEIARAANAAGDPSTPKAPLSSLVRSLGEAFVVERVAWWRAATPGDLQRLRAHVEDIALAADAMQLVVAVDQTARVGVDLAALLSGGALR